MTASGGAPAEARSQTAECAGLFSIASSHARVEPGERLRSDRGVDLVAKTMRYELAVPIPERQCDSCEGELSCTDGEEQKTDDELIVLELRRRFSERSR